MSNCPISAERSSPLAVTFHIEVINKEHARLRTLGGTEIHIRFLTWPWGPDSLGQPWLFLDQSTTVALLARAAMKYVQRTASTQERREQLRLSTFRVVWGDQVLPLAQCLVSLMEPEDRIQQQD